MRRFFPVPALLAAALPLCRPALGQNNQNAAWYLSGRVIVDDGLPPDERTEVVTTCNGQPYLTVHTDKTGAFSLHLGAAANRTLQDASVGSGDGSFGRSSLSMGPAPSNGSQTTTTDPSQTASTGATPAQTAAGSVPHSGANERALTGCDLQAKLPGYRSASIGLGNRKLMDNPNIGIIVLHRLNPSDGELVSVAELAVTKDANRAFERGRLAAQAHKLEEARKDFESATLLYPRYAAAWCELGKLQVERLRWDDARRLFETAIRADPRYLDAYMQLAALQAVAREWSQLAETTGAALHLDPRGYPQAYYMNAVANFNIQNTDAAEKSAREAERLDTRHRFPGSWLVLGRVLAIRHEFAEAAAQMREYLRIAPRAADAVSVRSRLAEIEKLSASAAPHGQPD